MHVSFASVTITSIVICFATIVASEWCSSASAGLAVMLLWAIIAESGIVIMSSHVVSSTIWLFTSILCISIILVGSAIIIVTIVIGSAFNVTK